MKLVVTLGDPAGIGPEVVEAALQRWLPGQPAPMDVVLIGPAGVADAIAQRLANASVRAVAQPAFLGPLGVASAQSGAAALAALMAGIRMAQQGEVDAIVTAPINKHALSQAGSQDLGHTEILARELGMGPTAMAFFTPKLRVVLATVHIPLRQVFAALTPKRVVEVSQLLHQALQEKLGVAAPRLGLAGLNPHAGEQGLLGSEETTILRPAVQRARALGINLSEPQAPDTVFHRALAGEFDGVVALYHDQGLIPVKLLSFGEAVNVTLGLRVVRTSPDHGTAYDKAGTGMARCEGMMAALEAASLLTRKKA